MIEKRIEKILVTPKLKQRKRVAAYVRVFVDKETMLHSFTAQASYYKELISKHKDWLFVDVYADYGISGTKVNRPEFNRMIDDCMTGKINMIITKSISRFARNTTILLSTIRELKALNIDVYFEEQNINSMSERVHPWLYTQDTQEEIFTDPKTWIKSNPSLGEIKQVSYLEDLMNKSKNDLATRVTMLCKDFNIKQTEDGSWLNFKDIENKDTFKIDDLRGSYAIGGVDLSSTTDLTCAVLYVEKQGKKYLISHFFMPSDVLKERIKEDSVPYDIWVEKGYITLTDGSQNDFSLVTQWFRSMIDKYDIRPLWVGYDPWNSQYWVKEMEDMGFEMEKIRQGVYTLSEPMKQLEADIKNHALNYNNNPIMKWCLANTQAKVDVNGNIQPSKLNSRLKRIDGTVATIIAYATLSRYRIDYNNIPK